MRMTRLEWRYLQKIALNHPYYDTHKLPLTEAEANEIVEKNEVQSGREFVDSVYAKLGMTRPREEKKRFTLPGKIGELLTVPPIRRIAIAVLAAVLLIVFFAATPPGRAIAESVIHYVATLLEDGSLVITNNNEVSLRTTKNEVESGGVWDAGDDAVRCVALDSFTEFTEATGELPIVLPLRCTELYYESDQTIHYLALYSAYDVKNGKVAMCQIWGAEDMASASLTGYSVCNTDQSVFYSIEENGDIYCVKITEDSVVHVLSKGSCDLDDLIELLKDK